jgi:hypothetical protein
MGMRGHESFYPHRLTENGTRCFLMSESRLKAEAEGIIEELGLLGMLRDYGRAGVVGSVALDLIVKRDIDVHLLVEGRDILEVVDGVYRVLLDRGVREVRVTDFRDRGAVKLGIDSYTGDSGDWSIDIWVTDRPETLGFGLVETLLGALNEERREAIIAIKRHYHERGLLRDGLSTRIYKAVVEDGVRTVEEFEEAIA